MSSTPVTTRLVNLKFQEFRSTQATDTSFASKIPTTTEPTGAAVLSLADGGKSFEKVMFVFYGAGNDDQTFDARLIGWQCVGTLWIPVVLAQLSCTLSTVVGIAAAEIIETERFADTITLLSGIATSAVELNSPANNTVASAIVMTRGFTKLEIAFDMTGATNGNCLYRGL